MRCNISLNESACYSEASSRANLWNLWWGLQVNRQRFFNITISQKLYSTPLTFGRHLLYTGSINNTYFKVELADYSSLVVGKVDCCNDFHAIHKRPILQAPALFPLTDFLLNSTPVQTIYHDQRKHVTVDHTMAHGIHQGCVLSQCVRKVSY